jgi:hypothetical protein
VFALRFAFSPAAELFDSLEKRSLKGIAKQVAATRANRRLRAAAGTTNAKTPTVKKLTTID